MSTSSSDKAAPQWDIEVNAHTKLFTFKLGKILEYKDLMVLMVRRDLIVNYKQTILGPLWLIIRPILTTFIFTIVFSNLAKLSTDGIPPKLFYLSGTVFWAFISECILSNSDSFKTNANLFSKVYFPRAVVPIATTFKVFFQFLIQFIMLLAAIGWYAFTGYDFDWGVSLLLFPFLMLFSGIFALGIGLILSSLTYKYRDLQLLVAFAVSLAMYVTPIVYPLSIAPESLRWIMLINPLTSIVEAFRAIFLNAGIISVGGLIYSVVCSVVVFLLGLVIFNRTEKNFMDTV
ncbi:ABC transporter permease [Flavimarina sp. Hel_I_48]|uniref:ABC transporter permease n=1 Tax=Flavimarina sp. Hel_I_48 TaxID=1392488 RepID=UPI0004DF94C2|nr:ABC transporter permease [Flavimarina sp. Hel_I_48]